MNIKVKQVKSATNSHQFKYKLSEVSIFYDGNASLTTEVENNRLRILLEDLSYQKHTVQLTRKSGQLLWKHDHIHSNIHSIFQHEVDFKDYETGTYRFIILFDIENKVVVEVQKNYG